VPAVPKSSIEKYQRFSQKLANPNVLAELRSLFEREYSMPELLEWLLFTALCLAHNYRARLILDMSDHVWTEVWNEKEKRWIHVDPSEKRIDDPEMYERDWKKNLKKIYAFENGGMENVTRRYKLGK